jgi:MFS family permease
MTVSSIQPAVRKPNLDFSKLWIGQSISMIGSQVTMLALPITAAITLGATSMQMGILNALGSLPALLFGLFAGVWVDRTLRRPILIGADIGRALVLAVIPVSALFGLLRTEMLYVVTFLVGTLGLVFDVAYRSYLPSLVGKDQLVRANSQLELSRSVAEIIGPGAAGGLLQFIGAPFAIAVDAFSFLVSSFSIGLIRTSEPEIKPVGASTNVGKEIKEGLNQVFRGQSMRALAGCLASLSLFNAIFEAVQILFLTKQVGLSAGWLGLIFAGGSVGFVLGALVTSHLSGWIGLGRSMLYAVVLLGASDLLVPLMSLIDQMWLVVSLLVMAQFAFGISLTTFRIGHLSLRQSLTPDHLQGRMNATLNVLTWGIVPLGGLLGGALGEVVGLSLTLVIAAVGEMVSIVWLFFSPVRHIRQIGET